MSFEFLVSFRAPQQADLSILRVRGRLESIL